MISFVRLVSLFLLVLVSFTITAAQPVLKLAIVSPMNGDYNVPLNASYNPILPLAAAYVAGVDASPAFPLSLIGYLPLQYYVGSVAFAGGFPLNDGLGTKCQMDVTFFRINVNGDARFVHQQEIAVANLITSGSVGVYQAITWVASRNISVFADACSRTDSCIAVYPGLPDDQIYMCQPADVSPGGFCANRVVGSRKFPNLISVLPPSSYLLDTNLGLWRNAGVRKVALVWTDQPDNAAILKGAQTLGQDYNFQYTVIKMDPYSFWSDAVIDQLTKDLKAADVDAVVLIALAGIDGLYADKNGQNLLKWWKKVNYTPKGVNFMLNTMPFWPAEMIPYQDYIMQSTVWNINLRGVNFRPQNTPESLEIFAAQNGMDAPQRINQVLQSPPFDAFYSEVLAPFSAIFVHVGQIMHKLAERTGSLSVPAIRDTIRVISAPSHMGLLQFDGYGRMVTAQRDQVVYHIRLNPDTGKLYNYLVAPISIGRPVIYPIPTWSERVYTPARYENSRENFIVGLNTVITALPLFFLMVTIRYWASPEIKAASPQFLTTFLVGALLCLISNYFANLDQTNEHCAAQIWFLTCGFTIMFGSLFLKTYRIAAIFRAQKLKVVKIPTSQLAMALFGLLMFDIILNIIWYADTGMKTLLVTPDPLRPQMNYHSCAAGGNNSIYFAVTIAFKAVLILFGVVLTYFAKDVDASFNESTYLAASIYAFTLVSALFVPIVGTNLASHQNSYIILCIGVMIVVLTSVLLIFIPKFFILYREYGGSILGTGGNASVAEKSTIEGEDVGRDRAKEREIGNKYVAFNPTSGGSAAVGRRLQDRTGSTKRLDGDSNQRFTYKVSNGQGDSGTQRVITGGDSTAGTAPNSPSPPSPMPSGMYSSPAEIDAAISQLQVMKARFLAVNNSPSPIPGATSDEIQD